MILKYTPEDFVVEEIPIEFDNKGCYGIYKLKKKNKDTEQALKLVVQKLKVQRRHVNYAGLKDRKAITTQYISIRNFTKKITAENILEDSYGISIEYFGRHSEPLTLGSLKANKFSITARDLQLSHTVNQNRIFPNYFGEQRFSNYNHKIGRMIVSKNFSAVIEQLNEDEHYKNIIFPYLAEKKNDYVGALMRIPKNTIRLFIHSFQSQIFNKILAETVEKEFKQHKTIAFKPDDLVFPLTNLPDSILKKKIRLIGFDSSLSSHEEKLLAEFGVVKKDFIIRQLPNLSIEGDERQGFVKIENLKISAIEKDELFPGKFKRKIDFILPKGSYATTAIRSILIDA
ncbi:tRNA pseudouridine(13) synthase TruD [Candidatus Woesearchaeota archaeon]|nr:tRNA pseudouridine(13) synthase TruD [Candidatus Woesearchaeota archaeon]